MYSRMIEVEKLWGKTPLTARNTAADVFMRANEPESNLRSGRADRDAKESELSVRLLFCRLATRHGVVDRDARPSAGATENLSKLK